MDAGWLQAACEGSPAAHEECQLELLSLMIVFWLGLARVNEREKQELAHEMKSKGGT